jgi:egghead protein (zeste-white 4 protein)
MIEELVLLKHVWVVYFPMALLTLITFLRYGKPKSPAKVATNDPPFIIFRITTKGENFRVVEKSISRIKKACVGVLEAYRIDVVTEPNSPKFKANTIIVPSAFKTEYNTLYKARANQYAMLLLREQKENTKNYWIFHMDEESILSKQCLLGLIEFTNTDKLIGQGEITYPNFFGKNLLTSLCDSIRTAGCLGDCRRYMNSKNPLQMHGSFLLVRSDVEDSVGWDFGPCLAEDILFVHKAAKDIGPVFGWINGELEEQSPFSLKEFFKQRRRWFIGISQCLKSPYLSRASKIKLGYRLISWVIGFGAGVIGLMSIIIPTPTPLHILVPSLFSYLILLLMYQVGLYENMRALVYPMSKKLKYHLLTFILTPLLGLIETSTAIYALFLRTKEFEVIEK